MDFGDEDDEVAGLCAAAPPPAPAPGRADAVAVCESSELPADGDRLHVVVAGRYITLVRARGVVHAIDTVCYHGGGPLGIGDIEDISGDVCIKCPWHNYRLRLTDGRQAQFTYDKGPGTTSWAWKHGDAAPMMQEDVPDAVGKCYLAVSNDGPRRQRTHTVVEEGGTVWLRLPLAPAPALPSDRLACGGAVLEQKRLVSVARRVAGSVRTPVAAAPAADPDDDDDQQRGTPIPWDCQDTQVKLGIAADWMDPERLRAAGGLLLDATPGESAEPDGRRSRGSGGTQPCTPTRQPSHAVLPLDRGAAAPAPQPADPLDGELWPPHMSEWLRLQRNSAAPPDR